MRKLLILYSSVVRGKPLRVDVFIARLAGPNVVYFDTTEGRTSVPKSVKITVEVTNCECALRSRLDAFQLISASLDRDGIAAADEAFQFSNLCSWNRLKSVHFSPGHWTLLFLLD
jgi:hypothetical protein